MDGLSAAGSIIAVVQITGILVKTCSDYVKGVKNARQEIESLIHEISSLGETLEKLRKLLLSNEDHEKKLDPTCTKKLDNDVARCRSTLEVLQQRIEIAPVKVKKRIFTLSRRELKWPLQRNEVETTIKELERYKSSFTLYLQLDQTKLLTSVGQTTDDINLKNDLKELMVAPRAEFDSYSDQHEGECLPDTRTRLRREILEWAVSREGKCIFWLNGMAGTGKSTISRTVAKTFKERKQLGASFFFKRGEEDRGHAMRFFPTIARQLVANVPQLKEGIREAIKDNDSISEKSLSIQFDKLILQPLLDLKPFGQQPLTMVIVIDALDECERDGDIRLILQLLPKVPHSGPVRLRFFLTSRPELPIVLGIKDTAENHQDLILHDIPESEIKHDISLFLNHRLLKIRKDRSLADDWPGDTNINTLITMSVPLFIFIATVCRIFENAYLDPEKSLTKILEYQYEESTLNGTYLPVLDPLAKYPRKTKETLVKAFQQVVGVIIVLESPLSITSLSGLTGISERSITTTLGPFGSVLRVPDDKTQPVRLFHLSFRDFLLDREIREKTSFWIEEEDVHRTLAIQCISLMQRELKKDICNLLDVGILREEITVQPSDYLLPELQYACRYWVHHLVNIQDPSTLFGQVLSFLKGHFLHWIEAMSLLGIVSKVIGDIRQLELVVRDGESEISRFLHDAKRFILRNRQMASDTPLQLYSAGLIFAPRKSIIKEIFNNETSTGITQLVQVEESWSTELQTLDCQSDQVQSVIFSPDGRLLASACDKLVRLWDPTTGVELQTLVHSDRVTSMAFTPNSHLLTSCADAGTAKVWDPTTGAELRTLEQKPGCWRVAFSPDGQLLAVTFSNLVKVLNLTTDAELEIPEDYCNHVFSPNGQFLASIAGDIVRLWNPTTGEKLHTLNHPDINWCINFSPNGLLLATGGKDGTVKVWDTSTGAELHTLNHPDMNRCINFSPNGLLLATGGEYGTVKVWDPSTGAELRTLKLRHGVEEMIFSPDSQFLVAFPILPYLDTGSLWNMSTGIQLQTWESRSVENRAAFSPDSRLLAIVCDHTTVKLRNPATGMELQTLEGHSGPIIALAFSPDGQLLASGSEDGTVRLWDCTASAEPQAAKGDYLGRLYFVAFSPDGRLLALGYDEGTVKIWNPTTGTELQTIKCSHNGRVASVTFSPDGLLLAFLSFGGIVTLWDATTGAELWTFSLSNEVNLTLSMAFSPDGRLLAFGSRERVILCDTTTGVEKQTLEDHSYLSPPSVAFSPDGQLLASVFEHLVCLWDHNTGAKRQTIENHLDPVWSVAFSPDSQRLASGSKNKVRLWDLATGAELQTFIVGEVSQELDFFGNRFYVSTYAGHGYTLNPNIQCWYYDYSSKLLEPNTAPIIKDHWLYLHGRRVLWLPLAYRPISEALDIGGRLALGSASGKISIFHVR
ncbi:hypothetical protein FQN49_004176 [Arthroderma sp. PD_2]|nr:hypothetical protein FQN49_004176 [Arthroderma sp. PD_2]